MYCCNQDKKTNAVDILRAKPEPCIHHKRSAQFICKSCPNESLLCSQCIIDHQNHQWLTLASYLTDDAMDIFELGQSKSGKAVQQFVHDMQVRLIDYQERIKFKIKFVIGNIIKGLQKLKTKFPIRGGYSLSGNCINQKNIFQIDRILKYQKFLWDTNRVNTIFNEILMASQLNINQNLQKMQEALSERQWDVLEQSEIAKIQTNFLATYKKIPPLRKFFFSLNQKNTGIKVINNKLTAVYIRQIPKSPVVLLDKGFRQDLHTVGFKITKMETHAHFFDMSKIYIGMCNTLLASNFGYHNFAKPCKGAYLISSKGICYHSKLPEYHDKSLSFSFSGGDIVTLDLNIPNGQLTFQLKTGSIPFWKKLTMPLALQPQFISQLRPCVMFESQPGAQVTILNETQLQLQLDGKIVFPYIKI